MVVCESSIKCCLCVLCMAHIFQELCILFSFSSFWFILCNLWKPLKRNEYKFDSFWKWCWKGVDLLQVYIGYLPLTNIGEIEDRINNKENVSQLLMDHIRVLLLAYLQFSLIRGGVPEGYDFQFLFQLFQSIR